MLVDLAVHRALYANYRALADEITHADLDLLVGKRGSVNSAVCLSGGPPLHPPPHKAESCSTNLNFHAATAGGSTASPVMTPQSENNKSFDSVLSSGIRSEHFMDNLPASTLDLVRFDMRVGDLPGPPPFSPYVAPLVVGGGTGGTILRRASSKSSSSLSDKSSGFEQGFESDHPAAGGTIKKRPTIGFGYGGGGGYAYEPIAANRTWDGGQIGHRESSRDLSPFAAGGNIRLGDGGTLLRRTASAERLLAAGPGSRNYEELQQLLDELHSNVRQAKDIQAKIKNSLGGDEFPPPPSANLSCIEAAPPAPPPRTSSRLSMNNDDEESLPPPPPELQTSAGALIGHQQESGGGHHVTSSPSRGSGMSLGRQLPPIAPKPSLSRLASSPCSRLRSAASAACKSARSDWACR